MSQYRLMTISALRNKTLILFSLVVLSGCSTPVERLNRYADKNHLQRVQFETQDINLLAYQNRVPVSTDELVYIYLEGDGSPWEKYKPAEDPNTRRSTSLPLLQSGQRTSLYLLRPCYGWHTMPDKCDNTLWTSARYSKKIVTLLNQAIDQHKISYQTKHYVLVGHSGGGTLAMLIASMREDVAAVVTIAANLDHNAWTKYFGYLPLTGSLTLPPEKNYPAHQQHWHLIAEKDMVIPLQLQNQSLKQYIRANVLRYKGFTHQCCWNSIWNKLLSTVEKNIDRRID